MSEQFSYDSSLGVLNYVVTEVQDPSFQDSTLLEFSKLITQSHKQHVQSRFSIEGQHILINMSLPCLVCHGVESPSHSFRSYSVSRADNEGRCYVIANCLTGKTSLPHPRANPSVTSSKVMPQPSIPSSSEVAGAPRLVRSHAVRRDLVRGWNFDAAVLGC